MGQIGVAKEYVVRLEDASTIPDFGSTDSATPLHEVPWSTIHFGRVENDISDGTIVVANDIYGRTCCPYPLHGWDMLVAVYRNGRLAHRGPLLGWRWNPDVAKLELSWKDLFAYTKKHYTHTSRTFTDEPVFSLWKTLIDDIVTSTYSGNDNMFHNLNPANTSPYPEAVTDGPTVSRVYATAQLKTLHELLTDLVEESGISYTSGPTGAVYDFGKYLTDEPIPALNEQTTFGRPLVTVDCSDVAGFFFAAADSASVGGWQTISDASWSTLDPVAYPEYSEHFVLQGMLAVDDRIGVAGSVVEAARPTAAKVLAPKVTAEAVRLTPKFGGGATRTRRQFDGFDDLLPGLICQWGFDRDCLSTVPVQTFYDDGSGQDVRYEERIEHARLVSVDVNVTKTDDGVEEEIIGHFVPWVL